MAMGSLTNRQRPDHPSIYQGAEGVCDGSDDDCDGLADEDGVCPDCPAGMVLIPPLVVCIDQYEAYEGEDGAAASVAGEMPRSSNRAPT